ncbi:MAG TPA: zinc ribbon domain-containing protein [Actinomycetota bacterium]|nr:zinc ribbon domain-containing protein [Actinomycetota bacterium]
MRRALALFGLSATLAVAWISMLPSHALATVTGPCTESIGGIDITSGHDAPGRAVPLQSGSRVPVDGTAPSRVTDLTYTVHIAGGEVQVGMVTIAQDGLSWSGTVDLESISKATVGLFEVTTEVQTIGQDCSGVAYVCIEGRSPFTTAAGAGAAAVAVGGGILLVLSFTRARGLGAARAPLQGFAGGATAGLGCVVLVQQFCIVPLTPASAAGIPVVVGAVGAIGASLARRAGARRARRDARLQAGFGRSGALGGPRGEPTEVIEHAGHVATGAGHRAGGPSAIAGGGSGAEGDAGGGMGGPSGPSGPSGGSPDPAPTAPIPPAPPPPSGGAIVPPIRPPMATDEVTCSNCGEANSAQSRFCTNCGSRLGA